MADGRRGQGRPRARRRHGQADPPARRPGPRGLRDRPRRGDARGAARAGAGGEREGRHRRGHPGQRPLRRRRRRGAGVPLVRPRGRPAGDRPRPQARRPRRAGVEQPRRADPVGAPAGQPPRPAGPRTLVARPCTATCSGSSRGRPSSTGRRSTARRSSTWRLAVLLPRDRRGRARGHLEEVRAFYAEYGRGMDGMQIPYVTRCYRADVVDREEQATSEDGDRHRRDRS